MEPTQLDQDALNLTKAIRQHESGGDFNIKGKSGEIGAYQFTAPTWKGYAKEILGDENAQMTPENQNKVAYTKVKQWKDSGKNVGQIASMWNAGEGRPDAYKEKNVGTNKFGVHYDTPAYAKAVAEIYQKNKTQGGQTQPVSQETPIPEQPKKDLLQKATDVVTSIFPGKQVGEAIGTLGGLGIEKLKGVFGGQDNSKYYDTSAPSPLQVAGDVAQGALTVAPGLGAVKAFGKTIPALKTASSVAGRIGQSGLLGAGFGATNAIKEGSTDLGQIGKQTATGGLIGGALGGTGEAITKVAQTLPQWISRKFITGKGIGNDQIKYAIDKGLGSPTTMLSQSDSSIDTLGNQLGSILKSSTYKDFMVPGRDILNKVTQDFPDAGLSRVDIVKKLQSIVPLKKTLVTNLLTGNLNLDELHTLNSALGKNTFKSVFDGVEVKANKEIGSAVYHTISDIIKNVAPESVPVFNTLAKEYPLNSALQGLIRRGETSKSITLKEIMTFLGGSTFGGPIAGLGAVGMEKLATSPSVNLKAAGLIGKLAKPNAQAVGTMSKPLLMRSLSGLFGGNVNVSQPKSNQ